MMNQTQEATPSFDQVLSHCDEYCLEAICQHAADSFEAFVGTKRGSHSVGTFKTKPEAEHAIKDALAARWNG